MQEGVSRARDAVKRLIEALAEQGVNVDEAYLFGSYARGTWIRESDVDVVLVSDDFKEIRFNDRLDMVNALVFREGIRPHIEAIPLTSDEFRDRLEHSVLIRDASRYWIRVV
ncbi:MAG: nucleotidyltransferase domain-containing protein [Candidatus Nitrosocaldus sp.]|nr:nucleotidyltransferase domain-containing protein [Candidatus Nitrosocaldus sp.]